MCDLLRESCSQLVSIVEHSRRDGDERRGSAADAFPYYTIINNPAAAAAGSMIAASSSSSR